MRITVAGTAALMVAAIAVPLAGQSVFPSVDVWAPVAPRPFVGSGGTTHLAYELHITNLSARSSTIEAVDAFDRSAAPGAAPLLHLDGDALEAAVYRPGSPPDEQDKRTLTAGRTAVVFIWIPLGTHSVPTALTHRIDVRVAAPTATPGREATFSVSGVEVPVSSKTSPVIGPPLEGDLWLAANGPDNNVGHRRSLIALAGQARIAQRYATDWVRLYDDGRTFRGDPLSNASYRAFGANVLAVADGLVIETVDGIPENVPDPVARAVPITPATLGGNCILLQLGDGVYATYAHLQAGSLKVKKGDRVRKGQVLALLGNTGNSSEPHLHFQVADGPKSFDAEGIPFVFASFDLQAEPAQVTAALHETGNTLGVNPVNLKAWLAAPPHRRHRELPLLNSIVSFGVSQ